MKFSYGVAVLSLAAIGAPATAQTAKDLLTEAAFSTTEKAAALSTVSRAAAVAGAAVKRTPADLDARFHAAMATGYTAKLSRSRKDAVQARESFQALAAADPRNAEVQAAIAGWHLDCIADLGSMVASAALGAKKSTGLAALDRSVALGGRRAFFPGLASLMRIRLDSGDVANARRLAESAVAAPATTRLDQIMKRAATAVLVPLRAGDGKTAAAMARKLLPFGRLES